MGLFRVWAYAREEFGPRFKILGPVRRIVPLVL